jgi:hypothetical protein
MAFSTKQESICPSPRKLWMTTFAGLVLALSIWSSTASDGIAGPTVTGFGVDDSNTTTLVPTHYITASTFLNNAIANSDFNTPTWVFRFVNGTTTPFIPAGDLTVNTYSPWVVTSNPVADPGGSLQSRPVHGADAGGANFALTYQPRAGTTDPGAASIHFLQIYRYSDNGQAATFHVDNPSTSVPWYDAGGVSRIGPNKSWMFDIPYGTEDMTETGTAGQDERLLSRVFDFQTFVAVDNFAGGVHTVSLYGGETWGYRYDNIDTPEPATIALFAAGVAGLLGYASIRKFRKKLA